MCFALWDSRRGSEKRGQKAVHSLKYSIFQMSHGKLKHAVLQTNHLI